MRAAAKVAAYVTFSGAFGDVKSDIIDFQLATIVQY